MKCHLLTLHGVPIWEQLAIEEALLRADTNNWCIINTDSPAAVVMGISGKPERLVALNDLQRDQIPLIKRYSGGGTVYIDRQTVFVSWICNHCALSMPLQPRMLMEWSAALYEPLFTGCTLRENDFVFGTKKFGGNAQYIQKERWVHHTSFLWDFSPKGMEYLLLPEKRPSYRGERTHADFLCTLRSQFPQKEDLIASLKNHLSTRFDLLPSSLEAVTEILHRPHRKATLRIL